MVKALKKNREKGTSDISPGTSSVQSVDKREEPTREPRFTEDEESSVEVQETLYLGLVHIIFKKAFSYENATLATVLTLALLCITDLSSSLGLVGFLYNGTFTSEAAAIILVEYSALPATVAFYINQKAKSNNTWTSILPELAVLLIVFPLAPAAGYIFWAARICLKKDGARVHKFCALTTTVRGVVVSPLMVSATSWLYLTECVTPPWHETTTFCDSMSNCLPLGPLATIVPLIRVGLSLATVFTGFFGTLKSTDKLKTVEGLAFSMPNTVYRVSTVILTATVLKEYAVYMLFLVFAVNCLVAVASTKCKDEKDNDEEEADQGKISILTSTITSLVGISIMPADPAEKNKNPNLKSTPQNLKKIHRLATRISLSTLPIFLLVNIALHIQLVQIPGFVTNPNNGLNNDQMIHILKYGLYPLAALAILTTTIFGSSIWSSERNWVRWVIFVFNLTTTLFTAIGLVAFAVSLPRGPSKVVLAIQTRDRISFVEGFTWNAEWENSTNEWNRIGGKLISLDKKVLNEVTMTFPQNLNRSNTDAFSSRTNLSDIAEENSRIRLVKPYPPSTDDTEDAACVSCPDEKSNYCRRLTQEVLKKNPHLAICSAAVDGWWSPYEEGPCRTVREVPEGSKCGEGWQMKNRECKGRKFGGKYCTGRASSHQECLEKPCPGEIFTISCFYSNSNSNVACRDQIIGFPVVFMQIINNFVIDFQSGRMVSANATQL